MISPQKEKLVIELSERKNSNEEHYKLITNYKDYDDSIASFLIDEIKNRANISKSEFNINRQITANPTYYTQLKEKAEKDDKDFWINHYKNVVMNKQLSLYDRAIAYITLYEHKVIYDKELDSELEKFLKDKGVLYGKQD